MHYFAWINERGHWCCQHLLPMTQISRLNSLVSEHPRFMSIQQYSEAGEILSCPLFLDFDSHDDSSLKDAQYALYMIQDVMNITPRISFSGNKGFHFIIPYTVKGPYCHLAVRDWALRIGTLPTLDKSIYRAHSMFRVLNSPASQPGYYKIPITAQELMSLSFNNIAEMAKSPRQLHLPDIDLSKIPEDIIAEIEGFTPPVFNSVQDLKTYSSDLQTEITPCIESLISNLPAKGDRHNAVYTVSTFLKKCGLTELEAKNLLLSNPDYQAYEEDTSDFRGVSKVIRAVFSSPTIPHVGCQGKSNMAALLQTRCSRLCFFRDDFPDIKEMFG